MTFHVRSLGYGLALSVLLLSLATLSAQSQTKASCNFKLFPLPQDIAASSPNGINDYGTVVGLAVDSGGGERGFTRSPAAAINYYSAPNAEPTYRSFTLFTDVNDAGVKIGNYAVNSTGAVQKGFMLSGSTLTAIAHPKSVDGTFVNGINKWNSVVGYYLDPLHAKGFKRLSDGSFVTLNFPGRRIPGRLESTIAAWLSAIIRATALFISKDSGRHLITRKRALPSSAASATPA